MNRVRRQLLGGSFAVEVLNDVGGGPSPGLRAGNLKGIATISDRDIKATFNELQVLVLLPPRVGKPIRVVGFR